ncbi:hypothetical protein [Ferrovibrio sp.]|uniref:hypothetical protein n=1 Tax=Ferrovibrio sp. TaxID=1917215 RepID=UPI00311F2CC4
MPTSRSFHEGVIERARSDPDFRRSLLRESVDAMLNGELEVGHRLVRDYIRAADYIDSMAEDMELDADISAVINLFDPDVNIGGSKLLQALMTMLQKEGLSLTTRRQIGFSRRPLS